MMAFEVTSHAQGSQAEHRTLTASFRSAEQRMGGSQTDPNPLELLLGSLSGCMNVVLQMVAQEQGLGAVTAEFRVKGEIDPRGLMGDTSVPPYFQRVQVEVLVQGVSADKLDPLRALVDQRCPVHRLLEKAGIPIEEQWSLATH